MMVRTRSRSSSRMQQGSDCLQSLISRRGRGIKTIYELGVLQVIISDEVN